MALTGPLVLFACFCCLLHYHIEFKGKNAIREMIMSTTKIPGFKISWEPLSAYVSKSGDLAYMIEQNQITMKDSLGNLFPKLIRV